MVVMGKSIAVVVAVALVMGAVAGCGSSSSADLPTSQTEASKQFLGPSGDNQQAGFGAEGSKAELQEAAVVVSKSLRARAIHDWAGQCSTLSEAAKKKLLAEFKSKRTCVAKLATAAESASPGILRDNLEGDVVALRVKGLYGYALYHGADEKDWAMPMEKEDGKWMVAALVAEELAREEPATKEPTEPPTKSSGPSSTSPKSATTPSQ
jgi:hypothetical protein